MSTPNPRDRFRQDKARKKAARELKASRKAENAYVLALTQIMRGTHKAVLQVVEREPLAPPDLHQDIAPTGPGRVAVGLGGKFTQKLFAWQRPRGQRALD